MSQSLLERKAHRPPAEAFVVDRLAARVNRIAAGLSIADIGFDQWLETEFIPFIGGASNFNLTLDTTSPAGVTVAIESGAAFTSVQEVELTISTTDSPTTGYQMKVWGDVDEANDANVQAAEGTSAWIAYSTSKSIKLSTTDALKTITIRVRDDVWNESSTASDTITLDTTKPVVAISVGPDVTKISKISGKRVASFSFQSDVSFDTYKVKVVPASGSLHSAGTQIGTTNGSTNMAGSAGGYAATTNIACTIDGRDLDIADVGDGTKIIKVFVQEHSSDASSWSL